jgi:hypothetical protein
MAHVAGRADSTFAGIEISPDRIEGGVFHDHDHRGSGEYRRRDRVLEPVRKMFGPDEEVERALGSQGHLSHGLPSNDRGDESEVPNFFPGAGYRDQSLAGLRFRLN